MTIIRSIVFFIVMISTAFICSVLTLFTYPLPYRYRYPVGIFWQHLNIHIVKWICGIDYRVTGLENLPPAPAVIISNHQSTWETLAFFTFFPNMCFVLKKELFQIPLFGWALRLIEPIAIDRAQRASALDQVIKQGKQRLQQGRYVVIFPEGKRMPPGHLGAFKAGAAALAQEAGCVIVPVTHNAGQFWQRRALVKKPGCIDVIIGQPISTQGKTVNQIRDEVRGVIEETMKSLS